MGGCVGFSWACWPGGPGQQAQSNPPPFINPQNLSEVFLPKNQAKKCFYAMPLNVISY